jgi:phosphomannomutase
MGIFKAYDIRGIYPDELNEEIALLIGRAFGSWLKSGPVVVGYDMRQSSPVLARAVTTGLCSSGVDVVNIGMCSTPMLNFAVAKNGYAGGVMVTASHNPGAYNGFKLCQKDGVPLSGDAGIQDLENWIKNEAGQFVPPSRTGTESQLDILPAFRDFHAERIHPGSRPLSIVVDCGNGITGPFEYKVLSELFPKTEGLYLEPDGRFPNHEANPLVEKNLKDLEAKVLATGADVGIAFDGDGDRVAFVDEKGHSVPGDLLLALMAQEVLKTNKGARILYDLRSSWVVREEIEKAGGIPVLSRVGHAFIKKTLREQEGILGGELSGHYYFQDFFYLDTGILAALKILELLSRGTKPLSALIEPLDRYPRTGEVNFVVKDADQVLRTAREQFGGFGKLIELDGVSVEFENWWFNLRKSNTEPLIRLNLQARDARTLDEKYRVLATIIGGQIH